MLSANSAAAAVATAASAVQKSPLGEIVRAVAASKEHEHTRSALSRLENVLQEATTAKGGVAPEACVELLHQVQQLSKVPMPTIEAKETARVLALEIEEHRSESRRAMADQEALRTAYKQEILECRMGLNEARLQLAQLQDDQRVYETLVRIKHTDENLPAMERCEKYQCALQEREARVRELQTRLIETDQGAVRVHATGEIARRLHRCLHERYATVLRGHDEVSTALISAIEASVQEWQTEADDSRLALADARDALMHSHAEGELLRSQLLEEQQQRLHLDEFCRELAQQLALAREEKAANRPTTASDNSEASLRGSSSPEEHSSTLSSDEEMTVAMGHIEALEGDVKQLREALELAQQQREEMALEYANNHQSMAAFEEHVTTLVDQLREQLEQRDTHIDELIQERDIVLTHMQYVLKAGTSDELLHAQDELRANLDALNESTSQAEVERLQRNYDEARDVIASAHHALHRTTNELMQLQGRNSITELEMHTTVEAFADLQERYQVLQVEDQAKTQLLSQMEDRLLSQTHQLEQTAGELLVLQSMVDVLQDPSRRSSSVTTTSSVNSEGVRTDPSKAAQQLRVQHQRNRRLEESNESLQSALDDARKEFAKHLQETRHMTQQLEDEHRRSDALLAALEAQKEEFTGRATLLQTQLKALQQQLEQSANSHLVSEHAAEQLQKQLDRQTLALSKALSERDSHRQDALAYQSALAACDSRLHQAELQHREETQKASEHHAKEQQALLTRLERVEQDLQDARAKRARELELDHTDVEEAREEVSNLLREHSEEKKRHLREVEGLEVAKSALQEALDAAHRQLERVEAQLHDLEEDAQLRLSQGPAADGTRCTTATTASSPSTMLDLGSSEAAVMQLATSLQACSFHSMGREAIDSLVELANQLHEFLGKTGTLPATPSRAQMQVAPAVLHRLQQLADAMTVVNTRLESPVLHHQLFHLPRIPPASPVSTPPRPERSRATATSTHLNPAEKAYWVAKVEELTLQMQHSSSFWMAKVKSVGDLHAQYQAMCTASFRRNGQFAQAIIQSMFAALRALLRVSLHLQREMAGAAPEGNPPSASSVSGELADALAAMETLQRSLFAESFQITV